MCSAHSASAGVVIQAAGMHAHVTPQTTVVLTKLKQVLINNPTRLAMLMEIGTCNRMTDPQVLSQRAHFDDMARLPSIHWCGIIV